MLETREELLRKSMQRLKVGQEVFFGPIDLFSLWPWEITVEKGVIKSIPMQDDKISVSMPDGSERIVVVEEGGENRLYIGTVDNDEEEMIQWVFPSEQALWDYREWDILSSDPKVREFIRELDFKEYPTRLNLQICRYFHDIMEHGEPQYQNMSCKKCVHLPTKSPVPSGFCSSCVRNGQHRDYWAGADGDTVPPLGANT